MVFLIAQRYLVSGLAERPPELAQTGLISGRVGRRDRPGRRPQEPAPAGTQFGGSGVMAIAAAPLRALTMRL